MTYRPLPLGQRTIWIHAARRACQDIGQIRMTYLSMCVCVCVCVSKLSDIAK